jgi:hypothetical protein
MSYNKPTANQISLGSTTMLDEVINASGAWTGSPTGLQGAIGSQGAQGTNGTQGVQGLQGRQGASGSQGTQGLQGRQGASGASIQGSTGIQGQIGSSIQGSTGLQGVQGLIGIQGVQGLQGRQGASGAQGTTGGFTTSSDAQVNSLGVGTTAPGGGAIRATGDVTAFYSDMRLKQFIGKIEDALAKVENLHGFYFHPNDLAQSLGYANTRQVGVSAQDVEEVLPEIIRPAPIDEQYKTLDYAKIVPLLIEAIKEMHKKIDDLEYRVRDLEF